MAVSRLELAAVNQLPTPPSLGHETWTRVARDGEAARWSARLMRGGYTGGLAPTRCERSQPGWTCLQRLVQDPPSAVHQLVLVQHRQVEDKTKGICQGGLSRTGSPTEQNAQRQSIRHWPPYRNPILKAVPDHRVGGTVDWKRLQPRVQLQWCG